MQPAVETRRRSVTRGNPALSVGIESIKSAVMNRQNPDHGCSFTADNTAALYVRFSFSVKQRFKYFQACEPDRTAVGPPILRIGQSNNWQPRRPPNASHVELD
jgi:hypothetical protein